MVISTVAYAEVVNGLRKVALTLVGMNSAQEDSVKTSAPSPTESLLFKSLKSDEKVNNL
jgi:hypothetical protein